MTTTKKLISAAAIAAGVGIGTVAGAMFGAPTTSGALESTVTVAAHGDGVGRGERLETVAEAIGISVEDLRTALEGGQTIAELATANGVEPQAVIDALVAEGTARIDEAVAAGDLTAEEGEERKANLTERATDLVNGERPFRGPGGPGRGFGRNLDVVADTIGISEDDLRTALQGGQTIAEVATANGVDPQAVIDALVAEATEHITELVNGE